MTGFAESYETLLWMKKHASLALLLLQSKFFRSQIKIVMKIRKATLTRTGIFIWKLRSSRLSKLGFTESLYIAGAGNRYPTLTRTGIFIWKLRSSQLSKLGFTESFYIAGAGNRYPTL